MIGRPVKQEKKLVKFDCGNLHNKKNAINTQGARREKNE